MCSSEEGGDRDNRTYFATSYFYTGNLVYISKIPRENCNGAKIIKREDSLTLLSLKNITLL